MKRKFVMFLTFMLSILMFFNLKVSHASDMNNPSFNSNIWNFRTSGDMNSKTDWCAMKTYYKAYSLNNDYNDDPSNNYYLIDTWAFLSLKPEKKEIKRGWFNKINDLYTNAALNFKLILTGEENSIYEYSPTCTLTDKTYSTSVGGSIGVSAKGGQNGGEVGANITASYSRTVSYNSNGKSILTDGAVGNNVASIIYGYNSFYYHNLSPWEWVSRHMVADPIGWIDGALENGSVRHTDRFQEFQNEMVEYATFIIQSPKTQRLVKIELASIGKQIHIDYAWRNSHEFKNVSSRVYFTLSNR